jgi:hypothetical protein
MFDYLIHSSRRKCHRADFHRQYCAPIWRESKDEALAREAAPYFSAFQVPEALRPVKPRQLKLRTTRRALPLRH